MRTRISAIIERRRRGGFMTDDEIIKVLEEWSECETTFTNSNITEFAGDILDLIYRQKAEIKNLKIELQAMRNAANGFKKENARLFSQCEMLSKKTKQYYSELYEESLDINRAEAVKKFAEKLLDKWAEDDLHTFHLNFKDYINIFVKEMTEEK